MVKKIVRKPLLSLEIYKAEVESLHGRPAPSLYILPWVPCQRPTPPCPGMSTWDSNFRQRITFFSTKHNPEWSAQLLKINKKLRTMFNSLAFWGSSDFKFNIVKEYITLRHITVALHIRGTVWVRFFILLQKNE